jgi:hypothetical protein
MNNENTFEEMFAEFLRIYKFVNHSKIVEALNNELNDNSNNKKKIYELSDGNRSTRDIQKIVGVSPPTITAYWKQWSLAGIVIPAERKGRYKAAFDLKEYGLSVLEEIDQGDEL